MHTSTNAQKRHQHKTTEQHGCNSGSNTLSELSNLLPHLANGFAPHTECVSGIMIKEDRVFMNAHQMEQQFMYTSAWLSQNKVRKELHQKLGIRRLTKRMSDFSQRCCRNESTTQRNRPRHGNRSIRPPVLLGISQQFWQRMDAEKVLIIQTKLMT